MFYKWKSTGHSMEFPDKIWEPSMEGSGYTSLNDFSGEGGMVLFYSGRIVDPFGCGTQQNKTPCGMPLRRKGSRRRGR